MITDQHLHDAPICSVLLSYGDDVSKRIVDWHKRKVLSGIRAATRDINPDYKNPIATHVRYKVICGGGVGTWQEATLPRVRYVTPNLKPNCRYKLLTYTHAQDFNILQEVEAAKFAELVNGRGYDALQLIGIRVRYSFLKFLTGVPVLSNLFDYSDSTEVCSTLALEFVRHIWKHAGGFDAGFPKPLGDRPTQDAFPADFDQHRQSRYTLIAQQGFDANA
jgi:hypothetical protein